MYCKKYVEKAHLLQFTRRVVLYDSTISLHQASRVGICHCQFICLSHLKHVSSSVSKTLKSYPNLESGHFRDYSR